MMKLSFDQTDSKYLYKHLVFFTNGLSVNELNAKNIGTYLMKDGTKRYYFTSEIGLVIVTDKLVDTAEISVDRMKKIINECLVMPVVHNYHLKMIENQENKIKAALKRTLFLEEAKKAFGDDPEDIKQKILERIMNADWYTDYSDDPSVRNHGVKVIKQLMADIKASEMENVLTMYENYRKAS